MYFTTPLRLEPRFSKRFALVLIIIHGGAILLLIPLALTLVIKLCLAIVILASTKYTRDNYLLLNNHPLYGCTIRYDEQEHRLRVFLKSGIEVKIASCYYSPQLVVLKISNIKKAMIIFPDALDMRIFRQLRVYLRTM